MNEKRIKIIRGVIAALFIPVLLNLILQITSYSDIVKVIGGDKSDEIWLSFWGSYSGGVLSFCAAIFVVYKEMQCRKKEFAINELKNELNSKVLCCTGYIASYQLSDLKLLLTRWYKILSTPSECMHKVHSIKENHISAWLSFAVLLQANSNDRYFYEQQEKNHNKLNDLLEQLEFFFSLDQFDSHNRIEAKDNTSYQSIKENYPLLADTIQRQGDFVEVFFAEYEQISMANILEQVKTYIDQLQNKIDDEKAGYANL